MVEPAQTDEPALERQKFESHAAFEALQKWLDLLPQERGDYRVHAGRVGRSHSQIKQWSHRFNWRERTAQHDHEQRRVKMAALQKAAEEMLDRHARSANATNVAISIVTTTLLQRLANSGPDLAELKTWPLRDHFALFRACATLQPAAQKAERVARVEPEDETFPITPDGTMRGDALFERIERYSRVYAELAATKADGHGEAPPDDPGTLLIEDGTPNGGNGHSGCGGKV